MRALAFPVLSLLNCKCTVGEYPPPVYTRSQDESNFAVCSDNSFLLFYKAESWIWRSMGSRTEQNDGLSAHTRGRVDDGWGRWIGVESEGRWVGG